ncbi:phospholipase D family protein [Tropicimonas isoalkanivorans]|uniref:Phospholipase D n=1 Tax=Tropicimonas isoalkanivorans TaxID=441112 RepID=A0A1I1DDG2_9RHOB|nr:phospholipase D family protein [Tropicimonas isoalkanivorans]SFB72416.1 Phosphatidylserine/phosphatidylglycerophosphate/cardiolipin synthase [Tropicimonas isoalkanivorans]
MKPGVAIWTRVAQLRFGLSRRGDFLRAPLRGILVLALAWQLASCAVGAVGYTKTVSRAQTDTGGTFLARRADALGNPHDGRSGIRLVSDGPEALALRLVLTEKAQRSIDAQYYLLHNDSSGHLFAWNLLQAADRGVRVRLLLDDMDVAGYDAMTAALDRHPNIEIRLYNPFRRGLGKNVAALLDFDRVNRRMHNKSMTFDNVVTIVGGRNIGDEYFAAREDSNYNDFDVLGAGPLAQEVSRTFDAYWNSEYAVPAQIAVGKRGDALTLDEARAQLARLAAEARQTPYGDALSHAIRDGVSKRDLDLAWVPAKLIADPADKATGEANPEEFVAAQMLPYLNAATSDLYVSSAYFVPRKRGVTLLSGISERGVDVTVLTNSLDSTDVVPVYGHYARSREAMLDAGIALWELRPDSARMDRESLGLGLSQSSLHTKAFAIDRHYLFVGSFNWDPRSVWINNEMGVLIESDQLATQAVEAFRNNIRANAYEVRLDPEGGLDWISRREDGTVVLHKQEPARSSWRVFMSRVYGVLPIGSQL